MPVIVCKDKDSAEKVFDETRKYLKEKLDLELNAGKPIRTLQEGFKFLGVWVNEHGYYLKKEKIDKIKNNIELSINHSNFPKKYHETIKGIKNYYGKIIPQHYLFPLDEYQLTYWKQKWGSGTQTAYKKSLNQIEFITQHFSENKAFHFRQISKKPKRKIDKAEKAVKARKREYELKEFENHELIITGYGVSLGISKNQCIVRQNGKIFKKVPLQNVKHISIQSNACSFSSQLILYCAKNKVPIDFTDYSGKSMARLYSSLNDAPDLWHKQYLHLHSSSAFKIAYKLVLAKMNNQKKLIQYFSKYALKNNQDFQKHLDKMLIDFKNHISKLNALPQEDIDQYREKVMLIEAHTSHGYWNMVRLLTQNEVKFENRIRKGATDLVNSMLNYGYSILYRHVWTAILAQGLHPSFSYIHKPRKNEGTLIFDMIEPFRQPIVDRAIISLINKKVKLTIKDGKLDEDTKQKVIIAVNDRLRRYDKYLGERKTMLAIIHTQAQQFVKHINENKYIFKPYQMSKW